ncbi:hypothetical protein GQ53DRAFT_751208 [Thozetella sp. PMI_491]|nr:hypothetical protein GQ53DRAFT_751208 [Thozetella sp. PMI_491]
MAAIPGLGQIVAPQTAGPTSRTVTLRQFWEWRFEVAHGASITVRLTAGTAERDGTELALNQSYTFTGTKSKLLTWHGCTLEINGRCDDYVFEPPSPEETPMVSYFNLHFALQQRRGARGPRVLVCGPSNTGKTSLIKMLVAYATKAGGQPLLVSLDPREGMLSLPGTMSAAVFGTIMDVEDPEGGIGVGDTPSSGPSAIPVKLPLVYYMGWERAEDDVPLWRELVSALGSAVTRKLDDDAAVRSTGVIVDAPAVNNGQSGTDILVHAIRELGINTVVVLGSARLNAELARILAGDVVDGEAVTVVPLDKSDGVVERDDDFMKVTSLAAVKEYFFGDSKRTLSPSTQVVSFDDVMIYRAPESEYESSQVLELIDSPGLLTHYTLAVMNASHSDPPEKIRQSAVLGFVYVASVDEERRRLKVLAPVSGRLERPLLWGQHPEPHINLMA